MPYQWSLLPMPYQWSLLPIPYLYITGNVSTICRRKRWFPHITSANPNLRAHSERQAINFPIQGHLSPCMMLHPHLHNPHTFIIPSHTFTNPPMLSQTPPTLSKNPPTLSQTPPTLSQTTPTFSHPSPLPHLHKFHTCTLIV